MSTEKKFSMPRPQFWLDPWMLVLVAALIALVVSIMTMVLSEKNIILALVGITFAVLLVWLLVKQQQEWIAGIIIAVGVFIDWYQLIPIRFPIYATIIALVPLTVALVTRLVQRSWLITARGWVWMTLLVLGAPPILWSTIVPEGLIYYLTNLFTPLLLYLIGILIGANAIKIRRLLWILSGFTTLIAIHTIIIALTGKFLLETSAINDYLASVDNFSLGESANRVGSFLRNPDWNGGIMATMVFVPIGLFLSSSSRRAKLVYALEIILLLLGLLFTYTTASWLAFAAGCFLLLIFVGRGSQRLWIPLLVGVGTVIIYYVFPAQSEQLIKHINDSNDASLRLGAWETAIRVILVHPLSGLGLGLSSYIAGAEPYRVPLQYRTLSHPHNSYLELAALAGLPTLLLFLTLLGISLWVAFQNYLRANAAYRPLLGGVIIAVVVFSVNSLTINAWTLAPLANIAWLLLGAISSPAFRIPDMSQETERESA